MKRFARFAAIAALALGAFVTNASAQNTFNYILRSPSAAQAQAACQTYGLTMVRTIHAPDIYLVQPSSAIDPRTMGSAVSERPQRDQNSASREDAGAREPRSSRASA